MEQAGDKKLPFVSMPGMEALFAEMGRKFKGRPDELIPILQSVQGALGYLPDYALLEIARLIGLPAAKVFGTATFYAQFHLKPVGKNIVRVCRGTACHVRGEARILREVEKQLGIKPGESTPELEYTLETVACIGVCALAPNMVIGERVYGRMNPKKVEQLFKKVGG